MKNFTQGTSELEIPYKVIVIDGIISAGKSTLIALIQSKLKDRYEIIVIKEPVNKWTQSGILQKFYGDKKRWSYHFQTKVFHDRIMEAINQYDKFIEKEKSQTGICVLCNNFQEINTSNLPQCDVSSETRGLKNSLSVSNLTDVERSDRLKSAPQSGDTPKQVLFVCERSCLTDNLFMKLLYEDGEINDMEYDHYKEWCDLWKLLLPFKFDLFIYLRPSLEKCMKQVQERLRDGEEGVDKEYQRKLMNKHDAFFKKEGIELYGKIIPVRILETDENFKSDPIVQDKIINQFIDYINMI